MSNAVGLSGVSKRYRGVDAVRDVSFTLAAGETVALVGHNGAGKTTLMKLMLGLIRPSAGEVRVFGADPAGRADGAARRGIGFLPENVAFQAGMTGVEVLEFYAALKGEPRRSCGPLLERVGLGAAARRRVGTYSKGMRQRLGLAQALLGRPRLLLLDEPTTGLDPALRQSFYEIVSELRDAGTAILLSSHALAELEAQADRVAIMDAGRMTACGTLDALRRLARLPIRIRLVLPDARIDTLPPGLGAVRADAGVIELQVANDEKMAVLARITTIAGVEDIDIRPPSLDAVYAHFRNGGAGR